MTKTILIVFFSETRCTCIRPHFNV